MADQGTGVPVSKALAMAVGHYQAGHLQQAEAIFRQVVAAQPNNADALHCLGVIAYQTGRHDRALGLVDKAIARNKGVAAYHSSRGAVLVQLGRHDAAIASFKRAIKIEPDYAEANSNLGNALQEAGRPDAAVAAYRRAIELRPDFAQAHSNLGQALRKLRKHDESVAAFRRAVEIDPGFVRAHNYVGHALQAVGRHDDAIAAFRRAGELKPDFAEAHSNLGNALQRLGKRDEAAAEFRRAIEINPDFAEAHTGLGVVLQTLGKLDEAVAAHRRAIEIEPDFASALANLFDVLLERKETRAALESCDDYLGRHPGNTRMLALKAIALTELGDRDGARFLLDFDRLIRPTRVAAAPGFATLADFNAALARDVRDDPAFADPPRTHATRLGTHSGELLDEPKGAVGVLKAMIRDAVEDYVGSVPEDASHPFLARRPRSWRLSARAVIVQPQEQHIPQLHFAGWLSGVYYVKLPAIVGGSDGGRAGWIEFGRPRPEVHTAVEPEVRAIAPEEGLMLVFPSYFYYRTVPFEAAEERISIAFDVKPER